MVDGVKERIRDGLRRGESLETIEDHVLDALPLDEETRSALWLYAWHCAQPDKMGIALRDAPPRFG